MYQDPFLNLIYIHICLMRLINTHNHDMDQGPSHDHEMDPG